MSGNLYGKGTSAVPYISPSNTNQAVSSVANLSKAGFIPRTIYVTGVTLNKATLALAPTETETLVATVVPSFADDVTVTWASDTEAVATVEDGVITAVADGEATITVTTTDGNFTAECVVTVVTA